MAEPALPGVAELDSFVTGYLHARQQEASATVERVPGAVTVRYGPGMGRDVEHFVLDAMRFDADRLGGGDWLTLFGDAAPPAGAVLTPQASEHYMTAELAAVMAHLEAAPGFMAATPVEFPTPALALFRIEVDGAVIARASCALAGDGDVILDRVATEPAWRGRGLARRLMHAATLWALAQGGARMLLIASPDGHALYRRLGFTTRCAVRVFSAAKRVD